MEINEGLRSPAVVGISFTRSHPLQYHTDRRCWFAAKEVAERTNNNKSIPNYKKIFCILNQ